MTREAPFARRLPSAAPLAGVTGGDATAPFAGVVVPLVDVGDDVAPGQVVATIEAIKMEAAVTSPRGGVVARVAVDAYGHVEGGDVIVEVR